MLCFYKQSKRMKTLDVPGLLFYPQIKPVSFYSWSCDFDEVDNTVIMQEGNGWWVSYKISELYYHKENARAELETRVSEWLELKKEEAARVLAG